MTISAALRAASERLSAASDTARLDAELLMAHALGVSRSELLLRRMDDPEPNAFANFVERRSKSEPVAYITGEQEFYGRRFGVGPGILIPRPDSETVIIAALDTCPAPRRVLDLGTGSGALLLTMMAERDIAEGVGIDASDIAVAMASRNAAALQAAGELDQRRAEWRFRQRNWRDQDWSEGLGTFDLILCNPPYVEDSAKLDSDVRDYEPASALFAGPEGLDDYRIVIPQLRCLMEENAIAVLEIGADQAISVSAIAEQSGFAAEIRRDLANRPRAIILR